MVNTTSTSSTDILNVNFYYNSHIQDKASQVNTGQANRSEGVKLCVTGNACYIYKISADINIFFI